MTEVVAQGAPAQMSSPVGAPEETDQSHGSEQTDWVPSQFNARTIASDGTLVIWNSYTNAISGFPVEARGQVDPILSRKGFRGPCTGLTKYMRDRGFIVPRGTNEFER
jgi:uncharacterized protein